MPRPSFHLSSESARLYAHFVQNLKDGDTVSYADLSTALGFQVDGGTPAFQTAKRKALNDGVVISVIRGIGIKRLTDPEKLEATTSDVRSIHRRAQQGTKKLHAIDNPSSLTNSQQLGLTIQHAVFAITADATSHSGRLRIQRVAEATPMMRELPISHIASGLMSLVSKKTVTP